MKKFLSRISVILCVPVVLIGTLLRLAYKTELCVLKDDLKCPTNIVAAVVGDSRVQTFFDPEELPWLRNFGLSAAPFELTAHKARLIADLNPHLQLLVIDIWPDLFFADMSKPYPHYAPPGIALVEMMTRYDMPPISDGFEVRAIKGVLLPGLRNLKSKGRRKGQITGEFFKNPKTIPEGMFSVDCAHTSRFWPAKTPIELPPTPTGCEIVLEHLLRDLSGKIKVVLTTTPLLWYEPRYTAEARDYFKRRMEELSSQYDVPWYNWIDEYQTSTNYWADVNHLNDVGAKVFSRDKGSALEQYLRK